MAAFGVKPNVEKKSEKVLWILEENEDALRVFLNMATQWIFSGMGIMTGLNYAALESVMRILKIKDKGDCFSRVRVMEEEALNLISEMNKNG